MTIEILFIAAMIPLYCKDLNILDYLSLN